MTRSFCNRKTAPLTLEILSSDDDDDFEALPKSTKTVNTNDADNTHLRTFDDSTVDNDNSDDTLPVISSDVSYPEFYLEGMKLHNTSNLHFNHYSNLT